MECPYCSRKQSKVTNKRFSPGGIRRRRECLNCNKRFTTYEKPVLEELYVIKKNSSREKFNREKLERGIQKAFEKRPIEKEKIDNLVSEIETNLRTHGNKEISSKKIGETVMKKLKKIDNVAYIRFASVYREFKNVQDFKKELKEMKWRQ